ncbi:MAG: glycosyltransferase family 2 protein [Micropruina sp.]|nr:glycosyltransferase family 2 protein [Micropruina sp.]
MIVSYNCRDLVSACIASLHQAGAVRKRWRIWLVDNASTDGTVSAVKARFDGVTVLGRASNDGFGVANNIALRQCTAPFVLVLNPDTKVAEGVIDHLLGQLRGWPDVAVVGCRLEQADGSLDLAAKRRFPTPRSALQYFFSRRRTLAEYSNPEVAPEEVGDVDAVNGAFMLVRAEAIGEVGLFDEDYWMYAEDLDWCKRFWDAGWRIRYDGRVSVLHLKSAVSGKRRSPRLNWHFHHSMAIYYRKHHAGSSWPLDALVHVGIYARLAQKTLTDGGATLISRMTRPATDRTQA